MQIDVLSQNTLKLTLSRLDMSDFDIKYENLSGKNPNTKQLLSNVLRTVKLDKTAKVDFSGERLFVEAFPRPDGGCMLYVSSLETSDVSANSEACESDVFANTHPPRSARATYLGNAKANPKVTPKNAPKRKSTELLCDFTTLKNLELACKNLHRQLSQGRLSIDSKLFAAPEETRQKPRHYRMHIQTDNQPLTEMIIGEFDGVIHTSISSASSATAANPDNAANPATDTLPYTNEHYRLLIPQHAIEKLNELA